MRQEIGKGRGTEEGVLEALNDRNLEVRRTGASVSLSPYIVLPATGDRAVDCDAPPNRFIETQLPQKNDAKNSLAMREHMPIRFIQVLTAFFFFITAFAPLPSLKEVTYRQTSGPVSPKGFWQEQYTVSSTGLTFVRNGHPTVTMVNTGTWTINNYGESEAKLFTDLSNPGVYNVEQIGQGPAPSGGGLKVYTIRYDNGDTRKVIIGDGRLYKNAAIVTTPINNYIATVKLPADASNRYK